MKYVFSLLLSLCLMLLSLRPVFAYSVPAFPNCPNPGGTLKVEYSTGSHAIPGDSTLHDGSDKVYNISSDTLVQCFCAPDGKGVQTNWWKISSLTESELQQLKNLGWYYIINGQAWGLSADPYMAKNAEFSCSSSSNSGSSSDSGTGGQILSSAASTTGQVLGLSATGNIVVLFAYLGFGLLFLISGLLLLKKHSDK
jgi:hypothetical protein